MMRSHAKGFTLIETVIAIVILSTAGITLIGVLARMAQTSAEGLAHTQSIGIAASYLDHILSRPNLNDIDDFDGEVHTGAEDAFGKAIPEFQDYSVEVDVRDNVSLHDIGGSADVRLVTITVTDPLGRRVVLSGFRTRRIP